MERFSKLLVVIMFVVYLLLGCEQNQSCTDGTLNCACGQNDTCNDGLICEDEICIKSELDGDVEVAVDGDGKDVDDSDNDGDADIIIDGDAEFVCSGSCVSGESRCMGDDMCFCEKSFWKNYTCDEVCAYKNKFSNGCGLNAENVETCICKDTVDVDGDTEADTEEDKDKEFVCSGSCVTGDNRCMGNNYCYCSNGNWTSYSCSDVCEKKGQVAAGCVFNIQSGVENCLCEDATDIDGDADADADIDAEEEIDTSSCHGPCEPYYNDSICMDINTLCSCDRDNYEFFPYTCKQICNDAGYSHTEGCNNDYGEASCICYNRECETHDDCKTMGKDICVAYYSNTICVNECAMNTCPSGVGCMDIGIGEGCGVCWDIENRISCDNIGDACGTNGVCTDICGVFPSSPYCLETCDAAPNTCEADETCMPLTSEVGARTGYCYKWSDLNCDTCGEQMVNGK